MTRMRRNGRDTVVKSGRKCNLLSRAEALERAPSLYSIGSDKFGCKEDVHILGYIKNKNEK
jgi:hypothetical protein